MSREKIAYFIDKNSYIHYTGHFEGQLLLNNLKDGVKIMEHLLLSFQNVLEILLKLFYNELNIDF